MSITKNELLTQEFIQELTNETADFYRDNFEDELFAENAERAKREWFEQSRGVEIN